MPNRTTPARFCVKNPFIIYQWERVTTDGQCLTLEGPVTYKKGDIILIAIANEKWTMSAQKFVDTYETLDNNCAYVKNLIVKKYEVALTAGEVQPEWSKMPFPFAKGNILILHSPKDKMICQAEIFQATYLISDEKEFLEQIIKLLEQIPFLPSTKSEWKNSYC